MQTIPFFHVDVFSDKPLSGNGLIVFTEAEGFSDAVMLRLTQEMRQFESIFLQKIGNKQYRATVFTVEEELDFAGHPVLGAAALLHDLHGAGEAVCTWEFILNTKTVGVVTHAKDKVYEANMNQGHAEFGMVLQEKEAKEILSIMHLSRDDLYPGHLPMVVSTGLPYLLLPLQRNVLKAKIGVSDLTEMLGHFGAKFIGVLEIPTLTQRTWDNAGITEDIATGSLAGPSGAYLVQKGLRLPGERIALLQGDHLGRPSRLFVEVRAGAGGNLSDVYVGGSVCKIAEGRLDGDVIIRAGLV